MVLSKILIVYAMMMSWRLQSSSIKLIMSWRLQSSTTKSLIFIACAEDICVNSKKETQTTAEKDQRKAVRRDV